MAEDESVLHRAGCQLCLLRRSPSVSTMEAKICQIAQLLSAPAFLMRMAPCSISAPRLPRVATGSTPKVDALAALWRDKQLQYTWLRGLQGRHVDFWQVTGDALDFTLETLSINDAALCQRLMGLYRRLACFPDVPETLRQLKSAGFVTAILSNGSPQMLNDAVEGANVAGLIDYLLSSGRSRSFQATSEGLSAGRRPPPRAGKRNLAPVIECLGRVCGIGLRHAGRLVQSVWPAQREVARRARPRNTIAR